jgi:hypothetical protein
VNIELSSPMWAELLLRLLRLLGVLPLLLLCI